MKDGGDEFGNLEKVLGDKYLCKLCVLEWLGDLWGIEEILGMMGIEGVDEGGEGRGSLEDISWEWDGKIGKLVRRGKVGEELGVDRMKGKEWYYMGVLVVGG